MCTVSMLYDYGKDRLWPSPTIPNTGTIPDTQIDWKWFQSPESLTSEEINKLREFCKLDIEKIRKFIELVDKAKEADEILEQPDCEDPEKQVWFDKLIDRLDFIEGKLARLEREHRNHA